MIKVITYGTYDCLHHGHVRLLQRAKELGDYLIVGVTGDDFDMARGKINVQQSLIERVEAVKALNIADEIIIEEYEGQKIDDIRRYDVDIFTVGSDWRGKFDYLNEYCKVVYLERTQGISSTEIRTGDRKIRLGFVGGNPTVLTKYFNESKFVNGIEVSGVYGQYDKSDRVLEYVNTYEELLDRSDAIYIVSKPEHHYEQIHTALMHVKHVLCESPVALKKLEYTQLLEIAKEKNLILMDAIKTAYAPAYNRLLLLVKSGKIGDVLSVDTTCTSLKNINDPQYIEAGWSNFNMWAPTALLPIFQILGTEYNDCQIYSWFPQDNLFDAFTKINLQYSDSVASVKVGASVKSEGELIISGTKGYAYVPAPWWKTDYFEIRYENSENNKRYFYQLDGEGIRYELVSFVRSIVKQRNGSYIESKVSEAITDITEKFYDKKQTALLKDKNGEAV